MRWLTPKENQDSGIRAASALGLPPLIASILARRGFSNAEDAARFLNPQFSHLHDPLLMKDMDSAVARLKRAIDLSEKILIYGDYDVDGTMAAVILSTALRSLGAQVETHIPDRFTDGYGMQQRVIEEAARAGARVIVSVDTGIREHAILDRMAELGIDGIITDHHLPAETLPRACAILNPRRADCGYPEKNLAGAGVAFKLAHALLGPGATEAVVRSYLKLAAIGSIADVMPLAGENRAIAHLGLQGLTESARLALLSLEQSPARKPGLPALLAAAGLAGKRVTAGDVAFRIAPRLNAAGRMENARRVIDLFCASAPGAAREIAAGLDELNRARQQMEEAILSAVEERMPAAQPARYSLVFAGEGWHRGVIGIVAQRVAERFHRPALVIACENGVGHGSGRSIRGFHLLNALTRSSSLMTRFGGHAQAAGFTLPASSIQQLEEEFEQAARSMLTPSDLEPDLRIDAAIRMEALTEEVCAAIERLEPFGHGNPAPVFAAQADLVGSPRILKEKHLKLTVKGPGRVRSFEAVGWRLAALAPLLDGKRCVRLAFSVAERTFQGQTDWQLALKDIRPA